MKALENGGFPHYKCAISAPLQRAIHVDPVVRVQTIHAGLLLPLVTCHQILGFSSITTDLDRSAWTFYATTALVRMREWGEWSAMQTVLGSKTRMTRVDGIIILAL
jgi:hypothetical protein